MTGLPLLCVAALSSLARAGDPAGSNNDFASATRFSAGDSIQASVNGARDPVDYLRVSVPMGTTLEARLWITSQYGDADLAVFDEQGRLLGRSELSSKKVDQVVFVPTSGAVYIRVAAYGSEDHEVRAAVAVSEYDLPAVARTMVDALAAGIVAAAYPTADYSHVQVGIPRTADGGFIVPAEFYFHSGWTGDLLSFELELIFDRDGLKDLTVGRYSGVWPPFSAAAVTKSLIDELNRPQQ